MTPALVIAGNLLLDDVVRDDGSTRMGQAGGAVLYAALSASLWSRQVGCVSLRGEDYPAEALSALAAHGVDLSGVRPLSRTGLRLWILYEGAERRMLARRGGPLHAEISPGPAHVPAGWMEARAFHLAPMPWPSQEALVAALAGRPGGFISLDPHLRVTEETLPQWRALLTHVDAFFPGEDEMQLDGAQKDPGAALRRLSTGRLRFVVYKRGARGGVLYDAHEDRLLTWEAQSGEVVDPTGCGDAFAASFVTAVLDGEPPVSAVRRGLVSASFALAGWGPDGLLAATPDEARRRLAEW